MAFPTSPSNNQVHKEGNRAFVYDSALGVWDHVREADRGVSETLNLTSDVQFPAGHIIQTVRNDTTVAYNFGSSTSAVHLRAYDTPIILSSTKSWVQIHFSVGAAMVYNACNGIKMKVTKTISGTESDVDTYYPKAYISTLSNSWRDWTPNLMTYDSPATAGTEIMYKFYGWVHTSTGVAAHVRINDNDPSSICNIIIMEVAG